MDKFDKIIKEAVEGYEAPYNAQAWANVSSQLGSKSGPMKWILGSAAVATVLVGTVYFMQDEEQPQTNPVVVDNTIQPSVADNESTLNPSGVTDSGEPTAVNDGQQTTVNPDPVEPDHLSTQLPDRGNTGGQVSNVNQTNGSQSNNGGNNVTHTSTGNPDQQNQVEPELQSARLNARFTVSSAVACAGEEFVFTPEEVDQSVVYVWDFGDGTYSNAKAGVHAYKKAGTYTVTLALKDNRSNKLLMSTSNEVSVNPLPNTQFSYEKSTDMIPSVSFINLTEDAETWSWNIPGLKTSTQNQFEYTFRKKGTYSVELTAVNEYGCQSTMIQPVEIASDYNLYAPAAFEPNSDGHNDYFMPAALQVMEVQFTMVIYDKSGKRMYETNNVSAPWDGTNMNDNTMAPEGAYVWTVTFKNAYGETEYYEGQVIIIR